MLEKVDSVNGVLRAFFGGGAAPVKTTSSDGRRTSGCGSAVIRSANSFCPVEYFVSPFGFRTISSPRFSAVPSRATAHVTYDVTSPPKSTARRKALVLDLDRRLAVLELDVGLRLRGRDRVSWEAA
jgi:hypothetical protein